HRALRRPARPVRNLDMISTHRSALLALAVSLSLPALSGEAATATSALQAAAAACAKGDVKTALGLFTDDAAIRLSIEGMPDELFEGRSWVRVFWEIHSKGCKLDVGAAKDGAAGAPGASVPLKPAEFVIIHLA